MATPRKRRGPSNGDTGVLLARAVFDLTARAIDRFGWPGGTVLLLIVFIELHATDAQKHEIIDMLIHPDSPGGRAIAFLVVVTATIFVAQHHYWKRKLEAAQREIVRLAEWKTQHQQKQLPVELHHTGRPALEEPQRAQEREGGRECSI